MIEVSQATWNEEFTSGEWDRLYKLEQMPRYSILAGYAQRLFASEPAVLDIGCGQGVLLTYLRNSFSSYLGVDFSASAIELARSRNSAGNVRFVQADVDAETYDIGRERRPFDLIVFNEMLYYVKDPGRVVARHLDLLGPRSRVAASMIRMDGKLKGTDTEPIWKTVGELLRLEHRVAVTDSSAGKTWDLALFAPKDA